MKKSFNYCNYRDLLADYYGKGGDKKRGHITKVSKITKCQSAYISQVFAHKANISLEQASLLADDLAFSLEEREFFFDLVSYERAGLESLRQFYRNKIMLKKEEKMNLTKRLSDNNIIEEEIEKQYYSHWAYAAIHIIVGIKEYSNIENISLKLELSKKFTAKVLADLESWSLISRNSNGYIPGKNTVHLGDQSPFLKTHHQNWRFKAIQAINEKVGEDLHYSSVTCINKEARDRIKQLILNCIEDFRKEIRSSVDDEVLYGINLDFFQV
jgi:uncharacterized protein (TIGR02147 family)